MISTLWIKGVRDLIANKSRTSLVIAAIALGVFGSGFILNSYAILIREMDKNFLSTNPASFVLKLNNIDKKLINDTLSLPGIKDVEARKTVRARVKSSTGEWLAAMLYVVEDFNKVHVDIFTPEKGSIVPAKGEIIFERVSFKVAGVSIGDTVTIKIPEYEGKELKLVGSVHAAGLTPSWMENSVYGFITADTLALLGDPVGLDELRIVASENRFDKKSVTETVLRLRNWFEDNGHHISRVEVPAPKKHPNSNQMSALLCLQLVFGVLSLILSSVLVINIISLMLTGQLRQIGILKTFGARNIQIAGLYVGMVLLLGLIALIIALPASILAAIINARQSAQLLNFNISSYEIPLWAYGLQIFASLVAPLLAVVYPIWKSSKITVNEAIIDYGINQEKIFLKNFEKLFTVLSWLGRPLLLSIRNTFRRRGRLILTVGTLAIGGAILIVAINIKFSLNKTVDMALATTNYDMQYTFSKPYPVSAIDNSIQDTPGVVYSEKYAGTMASILYPNGIESNAFMFAALPSTTSLFKLPTIEGRWLSQQDKNTLVINHLLLDKEPNLKVGDEIVLRDVLKVTNVEVQPSTVWKIVGIVKEVGAVPRAYTNYESYINIYHQSGFARGVFVQNSDHSRATQSTVTKLWEDSLAQNGIDVYFGTNMIKIREFFDNHLKLISTLLIALSLLIITVGSMGLASTMSMNIIERMREIGVLRSMGASDHDIFKILISEGLVIGAVSWPIAVLLSIPLTGIVANVFGNIFLQTSLNVVISPTGILLWLFLIIVITMIVGYTVSRKVLNMPIQEMLMYD